jgi:hypothetical protein
MDKQADGGNADIVERAKSLFSDTLLQVNESAGRYFYEVSGTHNVPGSLSFLLGVSCRKDESPVATTDATCRSKKANKTMTNKISICKLDKAALALQLVGEMKTPKKIPVIWKLLAGSNSATIHSMNNKTKKYIHVPQCANSATAAMALQKYNVVEQIVETVGAGVRSLEGLDVGALWLGKRLFEIHREEFTSVASNIGITVAKRMSPDVAQCFGDQDQTAEDSKAPV